uniref:Uncharacterized protein n=1 Tax=Anopheles melas TaxID=34690 RepID=A0A182UFI8_9DIPT
MLCRPLVIVRISGGVVVRRWRDGFVASGMSIRGRADGITLYTLILRFHIGVLEIDFVHSFLCVYLKIALVQLILRSRQDLAGAGGRFRVLVVRRVRVVQHGRWDGRCLRLCLHMDRMWLVLLLLMLHRAKEVGVRFEEIHRRLLLYVLLQLGLGGERNCIAGLRHCVDVLDHGRGAGLRLEWIVRDRTLVAGANFPLLGMLSGSDVGTSDLLGSDGSGSGAKYVFLPEYKSPIVTSFECSSVT